MTMDDSSNTPQIDVLLKHSGWVRALARSLVSDGATADDVEQKAWLAALERPPTHLGNPKAWLGKVVRNMAGMHWREQKARRRREDLVSERRWQDEISHAAEMAPNAYVGRMETFQKLALALVDLAEPYGSTLYLRFFEELTLREVAVRMQVSEAVAQARNKRGLELLRQRLQSSVGKDWRQRCMVFTVPLLAHPSGGAAKIVALVSRTKVLLVAAVLALTALSVLEPWQSADSVFQVASELRGGTQQQGSPIIAGGSEAPRRQEVFQNLAGDESEFATLVCVKTHNGTVVLGQLLLSRGHGQVLNLDLTAEGAIVRKDAFTFEQLSELAAQRFLVIPQGGGLVRGERLDFAPATAVGEPATLTVFIPDPRIVEMTVLDHHQQPVIGAHLVPFETAPIAAARRLCSLATDEDGHGKIQAFYGERQFLMRVFARGYAMQTVMVDAGQTELTIELDRMFGFGVVKNRQHSFSMGMSGLKMDVRFVGFTDDDWRGFANEYEAAQQLNTDEYVSWTVVPENGKWLDAEEITFWDAAGSFSHSAWMRAFLDPAFTIYACPTDAQQGESEAVPLKITFGPSNQFLGGYPDEMLFSFVVASGAEYENPYRHPFAVKAQSPNQAIAYHQGGGHYLVWLPPGSYEIVPSVETIGLGRLPRYLPGQVIDLDEHGAEAQVLLDPDEAYVGIRVLDSSGFSLDCAWILFPQAEENTKLLARPKGEVSFRFLRPGLWDLRATDGARNSLDSALLRENLVWPNTVDSDGIWSIPIQEWKAISKSFSFR
jgi:RNA polymerase sigma factor (sigma-70 family)